MTIMKNIALTYNYRAQLVIYYQKHQQSLNTDMENKHDTSDPIDNGGIIIARNEYDSLVRFLQFL